jgi:hypothetical protein
MRFVDWLERRVGAGVIVSPALPYRRWVYKDVALAAGNLFFAAMCLRRFARTRWLPFPWSVTTWLVLATGLIAAAVSVVLLLIALVWRRKAIAQARGWRTTRG